MKQENKNKPRKKTTSATKGTPSAGKQEKTPALVVFSPANYSPRLKTKFYKEIIPSLMKEFNFKTPMRVPRLRKIALNQGVGDAASDRKIIDSALNEMSVITGQKPVVTLAKKDISNFKIRKGVPVGVKVSLRGDRMYEFLDRLISSALPRIRDFRGISRHAFDGRGNYTLGIQEQIIFPEINIDKINKVRGMDITFVTNARSDNEARALLREFGMPFKKPEDDEKKTKSKKKETEFAPLVATKKEK